MTIYLFSYNNYYNRQVKGFDTIEEYPPYTERFFEMQFNPNDGLDTVITVNSHFADSTDYCIICNDDNSINSRWFITEAIRTRKGQYQLKLHRDLVMDYKENILDAPCFIEKATLEANSPFIFNNENFGVNQIKTKEYLLKDQFALPWIIAYIKKEATKTITIPAPAAKVDVTVDTIDQYEWYSIAKDLKAVVRGTKFYLNLWNSIPTLDYSSTTDTSLIVAWDKDGEPADPMIGNTVDWLPFGARNKPGGTTGYMKGFKYTDKDGSKAGSTVKAFQKECNRVSWEVIVVHITLKGFFVKIFKFLNFGNSTQSTSSHNLSLTSRKHTASVNSWKNSVFAPNRSNFS